MAHYYEISDFSEYEQIFCQMNTYSDPFITITDFVNSLNYVVEEEKEKEVCDFMVAMMAMRKRYADYYYVLLDRIKSSEKNVLDVYFYLKYMLLDNEQREEIFYDRMTKIGLLIRDVRASNFGMNNEIVMRTIYDIMNDDILEDFMSHRDTMNNYRRLDISKLSNITQGPDLERRDFDIMNTILDKYVHYYFRIRFIYRLVYCISDLNNTVILKDGETSISGCDDFVRRFMYNLDSFMMIYNYRSCVYPEWYKQFWSNTSYREDLEDIILQIPGDRLCHPGKITQISEQQKNHYIQQFVIKTINGEMSFCSSIHTRDTDMINNSMRVYLQVKNGYDYDDDTYGLFKSLNHYNVNNKQLYPIYKDYINSKMYRSLYILSEVIVLVDKYNKKKKEGWEQRKELQDYIKHLLKTYHFEYELKYQYF